MFEDTFQELEELSEQAMDSEAELYYAILDAIQTAKDLGLNDDHVKTLCYIGGVDSDNLD